MAIHVAILLKRYIRLILEGQKTVESRLTRNRITPFGDIKPNETIYFKCSGGPYMAKATAKKIHFESDLTKEKIGALFLQWNQSVCGDTAYWQQKEKSRYACFIELANVQPTWRGPYLKKSQGIAWFKLDDQLSPQGFSVQLTAGAIRNQVVRVTKTNHLFLPNAYGGRTAELAGQGITLLLPNGQEVQTDIVAHSRMLRWRHWRLWFEQFNVQVGDVIDFEQIDLSRYRVHFVSRLCPRQHHL